MIKRHFSNQFEARRQSLPTLFLAVLLVMGGTENICRGQNSVAPVGAPAATQTISGAASSLVLSTLTGEERAWLRAHPVIRVGEDPGWPPIEFADTDGTPSGMVNDYLNLIEPRLGVRFERIRNLSWQESYARLQRWDIDMTTSVTATPGRAAFWAFTKPYLKIPLVILTRSDVIYVSNLGELAGKKVAVVDGYIASELIPQDFPRVQLVKVSSVKEGLDQLEKGDVFALVDNMLVISYYLAKLNLSDLKVAGEAPYANEASMAVRKDWAIFAGILQKALDSIPEPGRAAIYNRWVPIRYDNGFDYRILWEVLALLAVVLVALALWNRKLSKEIKYRRKMEGELRESEERLRLLGDNLPNGMVYQVTREPAGTKRFLHLSTGIERVYGITAEAAMANPALLRSLVVPEDRARAAEAEELSYRNLSVLNVELRIINARNERRWIQLCGAPRRLPDGVVVWDGAMTDITDRKKAEEHINHLNRIYAVLSDINQDIVRERDPRAMLAAACRIAVEKGGFRMAWIGLTNAPEDHLKLFTHAGASEDTVALLESMIGDGNLPRGCPFTAQTLQTGRHSVCNDIAQDPRAEPWRAAALERGYHSMVTLPIKSSKKVIGVFNLYAHEQNFFDDQELDLLDESAMDISFALEVSRHEEARQRVEAANTLLATAVEQSLEITLITDVKANIVYVNPAFERITGYAKEEVLGKNPRILKSDKQDAAFYRQMWNTLVQGKVWAGRIINKKKNGALYEEELTISPVRDSGGNLINYVAVKRDVTQATALENQLRQSQKMDAIGHLAGGIAHDFNNLLTAIHGNASLMQGDDLHPGEISECSQQIMEAVDRAAGLTRQLLMFSRKQVMQPINLDLNEVVVQITKMLKRVLGEDIALSATCGTELPAIHADKGMMEQVILNLAINARDAMPEGGSLRISTASVMTVPKKSAQPSAAEPSKHVRLEVADTGCGISPEHLALIFEPFFTTKPVGKGTGLGLATVYGIVEQHHGWIEVASEVGKGTTFQVYLPAVEESVVEEKASTGSSGLPNGTETILLVEDDSSLRPLVSRVLERCGYTVLCAASGPAAVQVWQEHREAIALLLTDLVMPEGMTGLELGRRLQTERPRLRVIYTSGYPARAGDGPLLIEGVNFLQKPYSTPNLAQVVRSRLDQP